MQKFTKEDVEALYRRQAVEHGKAGTSTIQDIRTRELEILALLKYFKDGQRILEVGCGNGYVAENIAGKLKVHIDAFDYSEDLIKIAKDRQLEGILGSVNFSHGDVLTHQIEQSYDVVFSERCIQNLTTLEEQHRALRNISTWIRPGGSYVMLESFWTGLNNLNEARAELGLPPIAESWHNRFFVEEDVLSFAKSIDLECRNNDCFLSGYYFGSRVLLPALLPDPKAATFKSRLNDYFSQMPPAGDFSPMKILHFVKV